MRFAVFFVGIFAVAETLGCGHAKPPPMPAPEYEEPAQPVPASSSATPVTAPPAASQPSPES